MKTFIVPVSFNSDWLDGFAMAVVTITPELAATVMRRRKVFLACQQEDSSLASMEFWDLTPEYYNHDHNLGRVVEVQPAPEDFEPQKDAIESTECEQMVVTDRGVYWRCYPKHTDGIEVTTDYFPFKLFESCL